MSNKINGLLFQAMITEGALAMEDHKDEANALNVFPVPDGDTGTNMSMTMAAAQAAVSALASPTLSKAVDTTASALLRGARGNSGVILSLLFRGISKKLHDKTEADGCDFALALRDGVDTAYKAVMKPAEGTILTVSRVSAQYALEQCQANPNITVSQVFDAIIERAKTALQETTAQNPVLAKAGVVDAGAFGLLAIWEGMRDAFHGIARTHTAPTTPLEVANFGAISQEEITFTYCTEFIAERRDKSRNVARLRALLDAMGDSLVVVEDEDIVKVHVHTDEPNKALEEGLRFGPLLTVKIENMRNQHTAKIVAQAAPTPTLAQRKIAPPTKPYGFVAVAAGDGLCSVFHDLGADEVVQGGQTMNPSTNDILRAIDAVPAETVYILPNNKNIIMAAEQAAPLSDKKIITLHTRNIPQGISAMLAFDADASETDNTATMIEALHNVTAGQVTYAARDSEFDGKKIRKGEFMSLHENKLCSSSKKSIDVIKKLAKEMVTAESSFATIIYGEGVTAEDAARAEEVFRKENKNLEINVLNGGQPVYYFIISVE